MNITLFKDLLLRPESQLLDFKEKSFDFKGNRDIEDAKLIKDILSFSNTIRNESAYIIFGVRNKPGINELVGLPEFPDDAILQQKVKDKIYPKPVFKSCTYIYDGLLFGIIEIPVYPYQLPLSVSIKQKSIEIGKIYFRRGTSNSEATGIEIIEINEWLKDLKIKTIEITLDEQISNLTRELSNKKIALSQSLPNCLSFSIKAKNKEFERFCYSEITGYNNFNEYKDDVSHRVINVMATPQAIELNPNFSLSSDALLSAMSKYEYFTEERFFIPKSITEIESVISWLTEKKDKALASFQIDDKEMFPESKRVNGKVTLYMGLGSFSHMYERIRNVALKQLLNTQRRAI
jgi:hypothetical protein